MQKAQCSISEQAHCAKNPDLSVSDVVADAHDGYITPTSSHASMACSRNSEGVRGSWKKRKDHDCGSVDSGEASLGGGRPGCFVIKALSMWQRHSVIRRREAKRVPYKVAQYYFVRKLTAWSRCVKGAPSTILAISPSCFMCRMG